MGPENRKPIHGPCQFCGATVTQRHVIIQYETAAGDVGVWADCPDCGEIVDPTDAQ